MKNATPAHEVALMRRWVATWQLAGRELERSKKEELRALTEEDAFEIAQTLSISADDDLWIEPRRRQSIGLVEQQRLLQKLALVTKFRARFAVERDFALNYRVLRLKASNDVPLDVALGGLPFEVRSVKRASRWKRRGRGVSLTTCSAEDLVVQKAFAARSRDWLDLEGIVMRQGRKLDMIKFGWSYVRWSS